MTSRTMRSFITRSINMLILTLVLTALSAFCGMPSNAQQHLSSVWNPDNGDSTYRNPIIYADYSDPDVIRVGKEFYLVASSFDAVPGLPILHSADLVHWELIAHALLRQPPEERYRLTLHGNGAWAPAIRYHNGFFFIFYPDPDFGIYMTKARSITGPWSAPLLIKAAKGWIDPCPLWDSDGKAYLVNALAGSRAGAKSVIILSRMVPDGSRLLDDGVVVVDGHEQDPTLEGPKVYKRGPYYYIFAPAGGVPRGWEVVYRAKNIYGPYDRRVVLAQGNTAINGPHQGAWVDTGTDEAWFIHFQDQGPYGRLVLLEPMQWQRDGWPVIGVHQSGNGPGEPVASYRLPNLKPPAHGYNPADTDEFNEPRLGLQWQWQADPGPAWAFPFPAKGVLRLMNVYQPEAQPNLWETPNVLLQKFPARNFTVTTRFSPHLLMAGEQTGLVVMGRSYSAAVLRRGPTSLAILQSTRLDADRQGEVTESVPIKTTASILYFRARVDADAEVQFLYSSDGERFQPLGTSFHAAAGMWVGAKIGLFATGVADHGETGYTDFDWFRFER